MKFRNVLIAAGAAVALTAPATAVFAAGTVSANATASVTVVTPTSLTKTQDMLFGTVIRPISGTATVTLDANDHVTVTNTGAGGATAPSISTSAKFNIFSQAQITYSTTETLTFTQPGLLNVGASPPTVSSGSPGVVPALGTQEIRYGGHFDIDQNTTPQQYTGTLAVTVNYQ
jgi:hypothetical protein